MNLKQIRMFGNKVIYIFLIIILTINLTACYGNYFPTVATVATAATFPIDLTFGELSDFIQFGDPIHSQLRNQYSELNDKYEELNKQFECSH